MSQSVIDVFPISCKSSDSSDSSKSSDSSDSSKSSDSSDSTKSIDSSDSSDSIESREASESSDQGRLAHLWVDFWVISTAGALVVVTV